MRNKKYVMMGGYAFSEDNDMQKLKKLAKEGWLIDGVVLPIFSYRLIKAEPQNLDFAIDYQTDIDEEYFLLFESAGWKHELTMGDEIHLFSAPEGTKPIYSDKSSEIDKLKTIGERFKKPSIISIVLMTLMILINILLPQEGIARYGVIAITFITWIALIFTGLPYIGYKFRLRKLKRYMAN